VITASCSSEVNRAIVSVSLVFWASIC
jgi:hypothetical protein